MYICKVTANEWQRNYECKPCAHKEIFSECVSTFWAHSHALLFNVICFRTKACGAGEYFLENSCARGWHLNAAI